MWFPNDWRDKTLIFGSNASFDPVTESIHHALLHKYLKKPLAFFAEAGTVKGYVYTYILPNEMIFFGLI